MSCLARFRPAPAWPAFVVQHLDPHHQSLLPEILAKSRPIPVQLPRDGGAVQPDHVYIIPPNTTLTVVDHHFHLTKRPALERHLPIRCVVHIAGTRVRR